MRTQSEICDLAGPGRAVLERALSRVGREAALAAAALRRAEEEASWNGSDDAPLTLWRASDSEREALRRAHALYCGLRDGLADAGLKDEEDWEPDEDDAAESGLCL